MICITDCYSKAVRQRAKETNTEQDTPQDKERLKIPPTIQEIQDKEQHRRATTNHRKAIPKEQEWDDQEESIEDDEYEEVSCRYSRAAPQHRFTSISKLGCRMRLAKGRIELHSAFRQLYLAFADFCEIRPYFVCGNM
jgi:hypothetical protein